MTKVQLLTWWTDVLLYFCLPPFKAKRLWHNRLPWIACDTRHLPCLMWNSWLVTGASIGILHNRRQCLWLTLAHKFCISGQLDVLIYTKMERATQKSGVMCLTCACLLICMVSCFEIQFCFAKKALQIIVQIGVGGLPPISKHRKKLKVRGEAKYFTHFNVLSNQKKSGTYEYLNVLLTLSPISRERFRWNLT